MNNPGDRLRWFAARWCAPDTMTRVIDPLVADLRLEHGEAVRAGRRWKARLVRAAASIAFMKVVALCLYRDALSREGWSSDDRSILVGVLAWSAAIMAGLIVLLELPFVSSYADHVRDLTPMRFLYLVPQGTSLALPIGVTLGVIVGLGRRPISVRVRAACLAIAVLASAAAFVNLAWVVPAANQSFRLLVSGRAVEPGINELPLGQLAGEIERFRHDPSVGTFTERLTLEFVYHSRIALSLSPLIFVVFAFSMLPIGAVRRRIIVAAACVAFFSYYMFWLGARSAVFEHTVPAYAAAWLPNVALLAAAVAGWRMSRRADGAKRAAH